MILPQSTLPATPLNAPNKLDTISKLRRYSVGDTSAPSPPLPYPHHQGLALPRSLTQMPLPPESLPDLHFRSDPTSLETLRHSAHAFLPALLTLQLLL